MTKIGVTGGIGSGKTFVCNRLKEKGIPVYNCDDEAKRLMQESADIRERLCMLVGSEAYVDGILNKSAIAEFLFASPDNGKKINGIVHPVVRQDFTDWADKQNAPLVAQECALLYEAGFQDTVDVVIAVDAPVEIRLERAMKRDHATRQQIEGRMRQQLDAEEKNDRANYIVVNDGKRDIDQQIDNILKLIINQP